MSAVVRLYVCALLTLLATRAEISARTLEIFPDPPAEALGAFAPLVEGPNGSFYTGLRFILTPIACFDLHRQGDDERRRFTGAQFTVEEGISSQPDSRDTPATCPPTTTATERRTSPCIAR